MWFDAYVSGACARFYNSPGTNGTDNKQRSHWHCHASTERLRLFPKGRGGVNVGGGAWQAEGVVPSNVSVLVPSTYCHIQPPPLPYIPFSWNSPSMNTIQQETYNNRNMNKRQNDVYWSISRACKEPIEFVLDTVIHVFLHRAHTSLHMPSRRDTHTDNLIQLHTNIHHTETFTNMTQHFFCII